MALVTVVFGGNSAEHDISILTGLQCERVLQRAGDEVQAIYWDRVGNWFLVPAGTEAKDYLEGAPAKSTHLELVIGAPGGSGFQRKSGLGRKKLELGSVLLALHGGAGESGGTQSLFALMGVPCTGSTPEAAALGMDKLAFGALMREAGVPTLDRQLLHPELPPTFDGPYIVKPRSGGSSIGIEVVDDFDTAVDLLRASPHLRAGAVVEPYRPDLWDLNVAFVTSPTFATSFIEKPMRSASGAIYDYAAKYMTGAGLTSAPRELPADISESLAEQVRTLARRVQLLTGLDGVCRVDFLTDGEQLHVNEVNSIPGAMALYLFSETNPADILHGMLQQARDERKHVATSSFEVGAALRSAGGIAGKLAGLGPQR